MSHLLKVPVKPGLGRHIRAGHPWVFKKAIEATPRIPPGSVVDLTDDGRFCGRGYWDPYSAIAVRVLTTDPRENIDGAFFERKVKFALESRLGLIDMDGTNAFRLIHGEGDGLPGVIVDLYDGWAVMKLYSAGLTPHRPLIVEALSRAVPGLKGVVGRDELGRDDFDVDR